LTLLLTFNPNYFRSIGILGAGLMGAGIAQVSIDKKNMFTVLKDVNDPGLSRGVFQVKDGLTKKIKRKKISALDSERQMTQLLPTTDYSKLKDVDMVIEAVFEDLGLKHRVLKEVNMIVPC
jgi:3-hydroxyacyl-CoA dehydrogenase